MLLHVYRYTGRASRSVLRAEKVAEIESDDYPDDPWEFASEMGGDFVEVAEDEGID